MGLLKKRLHNRGHARAKEACRLGGIVEGFRTARGGFRTACEGDSTAAGNRVSAVSATTIADMTKRGYSREFTPKTERRVQLMIDRVPPTLLNAARAKAKREGVSIRALVLGWLKVWVEGGQR